jgi:hypothetical protein
MRALRGKLIGGVDFGIWIESLADSYERKMG